MSDFFKYYVNKLGVKPDEESKQIVNLSKRRTAGILT